MTTQTTTTLDQAINHALDCLRAADADLTATRSDRVTGENHACQWFTLGPITNCYVQAAELAGDCLKLFVSLGGYPNVQVSLTFDPERDVALIRAAVSLYTDHYGTGGAQ